MLHFALRAFHGRRLALAVFCALATSMLGAAAAQAAPATTTNITSPSDPFFGFDQGQTQSVTISGTSNGSAPDTVDILCYSDNGSSGTVQGTVASGVSLDGSGNFSTSVALNALEKGQSICRLRAVPSGGTAPTTGLASYAGPRTYVGYLQRSTTFPGVLDDYYAFVPQITADDDYGSYSDCGLDNSYLNDPATVGVLAENGFYCNDWVDNPSSTASRPGAEVDGQPAYAPNQAAGLNETASGFPALVINSVTQNTSNGDLTIVETDPLVFCNTPCTAFTPSGVSVQRTITQTSDGHIVYVEDAYSSTDGSSHTVNLLLENLQDFSAENETPNPLHVSYEFPGESMFSTHVPGNTVSVPATSPASILVENNVLPDGDIAGGRGAITYGQAPSGPFAFGTQTFGASTFDASNVITVPASGSVPIRYAYSTETTSAAAQQDAYTAEDQFQAAMISISSPANGATESSSPVTVTGTASAGSGVKSVKVNGVTAVVSSSGSFTASVPLSQGTNVLTAVVVSNGGASASASVTVNGPSATPPGPPTPPVPSAKAPVVTALPATQITTTAALLNGTVTPGSAKTTYQFQYGKTTSYGKTTPAVTLAASSTVASAAATISGLTPATTYHFRLVASSSAGSVSSSDVTFRTAARGLKLSVSPGHVQAGTQGCFAFRARSGSHGVAGVTVRLAHHKARTSKSGKAQICLTLSRGVYHATASKSGYKTARATISARPATSGPTFTG